MSGDRVPDPLRRLEIINKNPAGSGIFKNKKRSRETSWRWNPG
jgi:hypothetical protein